ncbi:FtsX-like permease family protein, partial [Micropruina sp.]|uniref:FtsX-like permease family protein n=1 Tax=Micropruina sp. TaxID=2737536 RepID=UPI0039E501BF
LNGADPRQLRRVALGQALLLGSTAALTGTLVGAGAGIALWPVVSSGSFEAQGPLDVPIGALALLFALGVLTALGSALVTTRGLSRLSLVAALNDTTRSAPPGRGAPLAGVLLLAAGVAATWWSITLPRDGNSLIPWVTLAGGLAALAGLLLGTPGLLRVLARLGAGAPVALRMALRDLARHRGRATAIVASVAGGVLILTAVWTAMGSTEADQARRYIPLTLAGRVVIEGVQSESGLAGLATTIHSVDPLLRTTAVAGVLAPKPGAESGESLDIAALRKGCTAADLFDEQGQPTARCRSMSAYTGTGVLVGTTDDLVRLFGLDATQADALAHGKLLVNTEPVPGFEGTSVNELDRGRLHVAYLDYEEGTKPHTEWIPAVAITSEVISRGAPPSRYSVLASTSTVAALGWSAAGWQLLVDDPKGPISPETETALREALATPGIQIQVERGFTPEPQPVLWLIAGTLALLAVIGAAMSTILAAAELRPFLATFTAVGAPPTLTRRLAIAQAAVLGLLASGLGALLGMAVGAPIGIISTSWSGEEPVVALPWPTAGLFVVAVPLIAGAVAAISTSAKPASIAARPD